MIKTIDSEWYWENWVLLNKNSTFDSYFSFKFVHSSFQMKYNWYFPILRSCDQLILRLFFTFKLLYSIFRERERERERKSINPFGWIICYLLSFIDKHWVNIVSLNIDLFSQTHIQSGCYRHLTHKHTNLQSNCLRVLLCYK